MKRIALVGCAREKRAGTHPARELYAGQLFAATLAHAEAHFGRVFILSGLHGLLELGEPVHSYDVPLRGRRDHHRAGWGHQVMASQLAQRFDVTQPLELVVFAGATYVEPLRWQLPDFPMWTITEPLAGMQIGERLQWFAQRRAA